MMAFRTILLPFQLLVVALTLGPSLFLGVLFAFDFGPRNGIPFLGDFMTFTAIVVAFIALVVNIALSVMLRRWARRLDGDQAMTPFAIRTVGGAVIFAFATFFASVAMMLEQSMGAFVLAVLLAIAIASRFPTMGIARHWKPSESQ